MDRKEISAYLIGCKPDELMAFKSYDDHVAAIGPEGKKYVYSFEYLDQAVEKKKAAEQAAKPAKPAKPPGRSRSRDAGKAPAKPKSRASGGKARKPPAKNVQGQAARSSTKAKK
jgi:hypothetical protein